MDGVGPTMVWRALIIGGVGTVLKSTRIDCPSISSDATRPNISGCRRKALLLGSTSIGPSVSIVTTNLGEAANSGTSLENAASHCFGVEHSPGPDAQIRENVSRISGGSDKRTRFFDRIVIVCSPILRPSLPFSLSGVPVSQRFDGLPTLYDHAGYMLVSRFAASTYAFSGVFQIRLIPLATAFCHAHSTRPFYPIIADPSAKQKFIFDFGLVPL